MLRYDTEGRCDWSDWIVDCFNNCDVLRLLLNWDFNIH